MVRTTQAQQQQTTWAVLDRSGHVVVLLQGADATAAGQDWVARGYQVTTVPDHDLALDAHVA